MKLLPPSVLFQPELAPSVAALVASLAMSAVLAVLVYVLWCGRIVLTAPREQQREIRGLAARVGMIGRGTADHETPARGQAVLNCLNMPGR